MVKLKQNVKNSPKIGAYSAELAQNTEFTFAYFPILHIEYGILDLEKG